VKDGKLGAQSIFWVGHQNFNAWIKYFKFKTESKVSFYPVSPITQKAKLYFIAFPTAYLVESGFSWVILFVVRSMQPPWCCEHTWSLSMAMLLTGHSKIYKCSSGPRNTPNIMPIISRMFLIA
jgi:hypothetical protein